MLRVNKQLKAIKKNRVMPRSLDLMEQKLWKMGYSLFGEKIVNVKVSNRMRKNVRVRSYYRGKECIRLHDIISYSKDGVEISPK